jgi:hypothetical protein
MKESADERLWTKDETEETDDIKETRGTLDLQVLVLSANRAILQVCQPTSENGGR